MKKFASFIVALGAISYGIPGSFFKMASKEGVKAGTLLFCVFLIGCAVLNILTLFLKKENRQTESKKETFAIMASGFAMAFSNTCYMLSLQYVSVAVTAVMMMQSVWLAIIIGAIFRKEIPSKGQIISVVVILLGTVLGTGLFPFQGNLSFKGVFLAFIAAFGYALTIQFTGGLATHLHPLNKTRLMVSGAFFLIAVVWSHTLVESGQNYLGGLKWGSLVAIFGLIFPLLSYSYFMPKISSALGAILSSLELPAAVFFAFLLLKETISWTQFLGLVLIVGAVLVVHRFEKQDHKKMRSA